tara:strand:- start:5279 stop:5650 length:372 start_codon:yes stop_codon:yes gene_type:complete
MTLPTPINWLRTPVETIESDVQKIGVLQDKVRSLLAENFDLKMRMESAKEGVDELQEGIQEGVSELQTAFLAQIAAYQEAFSVLATTLRGIASSSTLGLIPASALNTIAEQIENSPASGLPSE